MPQVKIKQGTKSSINNNTGVLNAGTLAVTTDTDELFFTHNDGTLHQLCDNVNKSGDTMTGNLNMSGNSFERAGFEVVASLPTANNFVGRQVTYQGRSYIWNGSAWKCDTITVGGYDVINNLPVNDTTLFTGGETSDFPTYCSSGGLQSMRNILDFISF